MAGSSGLEPADEPPGLSARLMALARMVQIGSARRGRDGFSRGLLGDAEDVLGRAGDRMRLSSEHTVVALAGGTGSGKSSLFNRLAGADFSTVGITRPVTRDAHACVWGAAGSGTLLDWLGVPGRNRYSRSSALDRGEPDLTGLVLLDLPDHDSVMSHATDLVDRLVAQSDVLIWVLDPQKYADAAVHRRFLVPMAGHSEVLAVVLNQSDLLDPGQLQDCVTDLRRLLDSEDLADAPILVTSAATGAGVGDLRTTLVEAVAARQASAVRIAADVDAVAARFARYGGDADRGATAGKPAAIPADGKDTLIDRFVAAAGVAAVADSLGSARELRAADFVGWPVAWLVRRLAGRDPGRKLQIGALWEDLRLATAGPSGAQQAEIDNALTGLADRLGGPLPMPWSHTVRAALRSQAEAIPAAIGQALGDALPEQNTIPWWWRLTGLWQGVLLGAAVVAAGWMALITVFGVAHVTASPPRIFGQVGALPWIGAAGAGALVLGALTAMASMALVARSAAREREKAITAMRERIAAVAGDLVFLPAEQELSEFGRYRDELRVASGHRSDALSHD